MYIPINSIQSGVSYTRSYSLIRVPSEPCRFGNVESFCYRKKLRVMNFAEASLALIVAIYTHRVLKPSERKISLVIN